MKKNIAEIIKVSTEIYDKGLVSGKSGNISARFKGENGDIVAITPTLKSLYELTEEEQALFHNIGTAEGTLRLYADGDEVEIPVTFTDGQISSAINSTISFKTSNETYLLYKDGSKITANSTEEADLELVFIPKTKYTPISEELLSDNIATKKYVDDAIAAIINGDEVAY